MEEIKYIPGDLVKFKDKVQAITNIDRQTSYRIEISMENGICVCKPEDIETHISPIPISPEILKKNGWNEVGLNVFEHPNNSLIEVHLYTVQSSEVYYENELLLEFDYVHQLQHLLFGLGLDSNLKV